jgi:membrane-bound lytic murein transglycosylase D
MKWFGISLQSQISISKAMLVCFAFAAGALGLMSFRPDSGKLMSNASDSTLNEKLAFRSLFNNRAFDASKPYESQLNPRAVSFVQEYIRRHGDGLEKMKSWGKPYFDLYDNILVTYGLPREMKYLSVIESNLGANLVSWAGAAGPWQLMPYEAKRFGLRVNGSVDDRTDYYKSTHAAAKLMKELYGEFQDWLLVVAAYNAGAGRVKQAIRKAGSKDFWDLQYHLPEETRNHVKKFIGTHYAFEGAGGWTTMTAAEIEAHKASIMEPKDVVLSPEELNNTTVLEISGRYNSLIVTNGLMMDITQFNRWNPGFDKTLAEGKKYTMRILKDKEAVFHARKQQLLMESVKALLSGATASNGK